MQCLSSPTRQDIDKAHAQLNWLDIGIPSIRNLRRITGKRIIFWWLLAISSLPLHLIYNSAVFDTLVFEEYTVYVVAKEFESGAPYDIDSIPYYGMSGAYPFNVPVGSAWVLDIKSRLDTLRELSSNNALKKLSGEKCIRQYGTGFSPKYKDLLAVSATSNITNSLLYFDMGNGPPRPRQDISSWYCSFAYDSEDCDFEKAAKSAHDWKIPGIGFPNAMLHDYPIDYCLCREKTNDRCMLQFSLPFMLIVIVCNMVKTICLSSTVMQESHPLVTLGDAIASFLNKPDAATKNICLADKSFFQKGGWQEKTITWKSERRRWFQAASKRRWLVCNVL